MHTKYACYFSIIFLDIKWLIAISYYPLEAQIIQKFRWPFGMGNYLLYSSLKETGDVFTSSFFISEKWKHKMQNAL